MHLASATGRGARTAEVDVAGTRRLLDAAAAAGVRHLLYVSIVGTDRVPIGYRNAGGQITAALVDGPLWAVREYGGPEVLDSAALIRQWQRARVPAARSCRCGCPVGRPAPCGPVR